MTRQQKAVTWTAAIAMALAASAVGVRTLTRGSLHAILSPLTLTGAVLRQDTDPWKQTPLANVGVTALDGSLLVQGTSDSSGLFRLTIRRGVYTGRFLKLKFKHVGYEPLEMTVTSAADKLYIVRLHPVAASLRLDRVNPPAKILSVKDVRVRYLFKDQTTINVGTLAKQFDVPNVGNVPCQNRQPCSPDGTWKAADKLLPLDAEPGNEFQNMRVSCIAGPCPFTKVRPDDMPHSARKVEVSVLNWSDTAGFLVEADVTRTMATDVLHYSYPFIVGQSMNFALPDGSQGVSVEASIDGQAIVFPLGPSAILSWAVCSVEIPKGRNRIFRCELKAGYRFEE